MGAAAGRPSPGVLAAGQHLQLPLSCLLPSNSPHSDHSAVCSAPPGEPSQQDHLMRHSSIRKAAGELDWADLRRIGQAVGRW